MGTVREGSTLSQLAPGSNELIGVSDGSVKDGEGSAGYVIVNRTNDTKMEASLPVHGAPEVMTSYRTELHGIMAMSLAIQRKSRRA